MKETPIGLVIKEIAAEKNFKPSQLAEKSKKSRQGIYVVFGRSEMTNTEIEEWANILGVTKDYLFDRWKKPSQQQTNLDSNYLMEHLSGLEEQFKRLLEQLSIKDQQLSVKDRQIEKLMDILGKHEPASVLSKVKPLYSELLQVAIA